MTTRITAVVWIAFLLAAPALGQSPADLLQKGIYTQDTLGDLDGAIRLYRQVIGAAAQSRAYAAQAQYRLALCLIRKGQNTEAEAAFRKLVADYPEEKELAARAREHLPGDTKLLPIPWKENELVEYRLREMNGQEVGAVIHSVEQGTGGAHTWLMVSRWYASAMPIHLSRVETELDTLRPIRSLIHLNTMGEYRIEYQDRQVQVKVGNKEPRAVAVVEQPVFDNEELFFLLRRLPLAVGYETTLHVMSPTGILLDLPLVVHTMEDVQVPAGKFHCYRAEFTTVNQTLWIADGPSRPLVKVESNALFELTSIRKIDRQTPVHYQDPKTGLSFTAAPGWITWPDEVMKPDETSISMLDPDSRIPLNVWAKQIKTAPSEVDHAIRAAIDKRVEERSNDLKDYHVLPDTIKMRQIGGNQALTCVAEYLKGQEKMVDYMVWVRSENTSVLFSAFGPATDLDEFHRRLDPIIETVQLK